MKATDFKAMLQTPSRPVDGALDMKHVIKAAPRRHEKDKEKKPKLPGPAPKAGGGGGGKGGKDWRERREQGAKGVQYRDRAEERRNASNPDYKNDAELLEKVGMTPMIPRTVQTHAATFATPFVTPAMARMNPQLAQQLSTIKAAEGAIPNPEAENISDDEVQRRRQAQILDEIQKSKALGGDEVHTHLVKGLDVALLQKTRARLQDEQAKVDVESGLAAHTAAEEGRARATALAPHPVKKAQPAVPSVEVHTGMGRGVLASLDAAGFVAKPAARQALSSKTFFTFDASLQEACEPPRVSVRSGILASAGPQSAMCSVAGDLLKSLAEIVAKKGTKVRRVPRGAKPAAGAAAAPATPAVRLVGDLKPPALPTLPSGLGGPAVHRSEGGVQQQQRQRQMQRQPPAAAAAKPATKGPTMGAKLFGDVGSDDDDDDSSGGGGVPVAKAGLPAKFTPPPPGPAAARDDVSDDGSDTDRAVAEMQQDLMRRKMQEEAEAARRAKAAQRTGDEDSDDDYEIPDEPIQMPSEGAAKPSADDDYAECFPDSWAGPNKHGFAAGMMDLDEGDGDFDDEDKRGGKDTKRKGERLEKMKHDAKLDRQFRQFERSAESRKKRGADGGDAPDTKRSRNS